MAYLKTAKDPGAVDRSRARMKLLASIMGGFRVTPSHGSAKDGLVVSADWYGVVQVALLGTRCRPTFGEYSSFLAQYGGGDPRCVWGEYTWDVSFEDYGEDSFEEGKVWYRERLGTRRGPQIMCCLVFCRQGNSGIGAEEATGEVASSYTGTVLGAS
ncbi:hypothetical protein NDU88_002473 [Pleurodeles waltl]|uniref:Uncharacterized protein n=1 Tax=Pleurodeles waltl TaxID=8319 RepID=A0AAV7Q636_PLEWA|nr:hypothetical protein NDU88_002473 [Pleurodeles waltl]